MSFKNYIPIAHFRPWRTFRWRTRQKFLRILGRRWGFKYYSAIPIGFSNKGNRILKLTRNTLIGSKGDLIVLPEDEEIYESIRRFGTWALDSSSFLSEGLLELNRKSNLSSEKIAFLDIGANCGFVSLQVMNISKNNNSFVLVEPIDLHVEAISHNLAEKIKKDLVTICPFALSDRDGKTQIYSEIANMGNSSLFQNLIPTSHQTKFEVTTVDTSKFFWHYLNDYEKIVLKSDIQGFDADVLSRFPDLFWQKINRAVIEIWSIPQIDHRSVDRLLDRISIFKMGWSMRDIGEITRKEVREFWLSQESATRDLYLQKV